ncbi:MAG: uroporphyrinogen-III synthase [Proteobacteria bacterium]|nr:uroporphyrinogen-III synthase [Pseudomonadota bacterium]
MTLGILWTQTSFQKEQFEIFQCNNSALKINFFYDPLLIIKPYALLKEEDFNGYQGICVTSQHALASLKEGIPLNLPLYTVGKKTFEMASKMGFKTIFSAEGSAEDLKNLLLREKNLLKGTLLYVRGKHIQKDLKKELKKEGLKVQEKIVYEAFLKKSFNEEVIEGFKDKKITDVFLFSQRGAEAFMKNFKALKIEKGEGNLRVFCLSSKIAQILSHGSLKEKYTGIYAAQKPTLESLWNLFCEMVKIK